MLQLLMSTMSSDPFIAGLQSLDDPVMGGKSSSSISLSEAGNFLWSGQVIMEGGGFCGNRVQVSKHPWTNQAQPPANKASASRRPGNLSNLAFLPAWIILT